MNAPASSAEIYEHFRGLITSGELGAGERLPTVRQVARDLGVALGTAARAYKMLESDNLVLSRTGSGTTVAPDSARLPKDVVLQIRRLVALAHKNDNSLEDVVSVVRTVWR